MQHLCLFVARTFSIFDFVINFPSSPTLLLFLMLPSGKSECRFVLRERKIMVFFDGCERFVFDFVIDFPCSPTLLLFLVLPSEKSECHFVLRVPKIMVFFEGCERLVVVAKAFSHSLSNCRTRSSTSDSHPVFFLIMLSVLLTSFSVYQWDVDYCWLFLSCDTSER